MDTEIVKPILEELNLSHKEIEVYLSLLMLGSQGATAIAKKSKLNRVTTYHLLKSLLEKGLVSYTIKGGIKSFQAADPKVILRTLKEREGRFSTIVPYLESIKESILEHPKVEIFEGKEGIKSIMDDLINAKQEIISVGSEKLDEVVGFYFPHFIQRRIKEKIKLKIMFQKSKYSQKMKTKDQLELRETRFINCGEVTTGIYVYGQKVAFLTFLKEQPMGLIIDDKSLVHTIKIMLELLWVNSQKN